MKCLQYEQQLNTDCVLSCHILTAEPFSISEQPLRFLKKKKTSSQVLPVKAIQNLTKATPVDLVHDGLHLATRVPWTCCHNSASFALAGMWMLQSSLFLSSPLSSPFPPKKHVPKFPTEPFGNCVNISLLLSAGTTHAAGWSYHKISHSNWTRSSPLAPHQFLMW